ncbi:3579_t:CDS:1, partial [Dentiscutata erythropus]
ISQQVRNDSDSLYDLLLENYEWQCLEELIILLQPFAQSITFMGGSHYPTLGMMYPMIQKLFKYLNTVKLATFEVQEVCKEIKQSMSNHWDEPKEAGLIVSYLDSRFKNLHFLNSEEKMETINLLCIQIIKSSDSYSCTNTSSYIKNTQEHIM